MTQFARSPVTAVLGPTNTGKTHLAVERMMGHASGIMGFPLRLLAREVYDRVVKVKGEHQVALVTGEERIVPPQAKWFLCTVESMPLLSGNAAKATGIEREAAFVGIDEAQLGADPERGHVFTDRLLHARGYAETMILGSNSLRPMLKALVPDAEIIGRPRFSTLTYAGARKLSRLPKRSAIVAFSAEEVYAVAEAIRRLRGGAAVVMGALSPRTRNAQVAMFQAGEVDYLVATDAIGMGLNMDVAHVAFAGLHKFDGHRRRRLTVAEMAQIAGRAGRHQRDGTFGALVDDGPGAFAPEEVLAIEEHQVPPLSHLYWREGSPDFASLDALIDSLERKPRDEVLRAAPQAVDLAVLKKLAEEDWVRARARHPVILRRLWAACGLPDFRKLGVDPHARFVGRVFQHLSEGRGHLPHQWFADEIARLDRLDGDVETLAGRIAAARSWAYIAHRSDWLEDPAHWAGRTRELEERLSDALHASLTQRFVDKRTTALLRQIGAGAGHLPVVVGPEGEVTVEEHELGRIDGFRFRVAPEAKAADKRLLLSAAEKHLSGEFAKRGGALIDAPDEALSLGADAPVVVWQSHVVARLESGPVLTRPQVVLDRALDCLDRTLRDKARARIAAWVEGQVRRHVPALVMLDGAVRDPEAPGVLRAFIAALADAGGIAPRESLSTSLDHLEPGPRRWLRRAGIVIGTLDVFDPRLLKPEPTRWRRALAAARGALPPGDPPPVGATVLAHPAPGFRRIGGQFVRVDLVERIARAAHDAREGRKPFVPDPALATSIGLAPATFARLMAMIGFQHNARDGEAPAWTWRGRPRRREATAPAKPRPGNAFAALAGLDLRGG